nr:unnamed protein product [Callosobruchus chinensis]
MDNYIGKFDVQDVETHISETINDFKQKTISDGYDLIYNRGGINKNDGVIIYVKSDLQYSYEIHQIQDIGVVNMLIKYVDKTFNIIALYRSPSTSVDEFTHHLNIFLKQRQILI